MASERQLQWILNIVDMTFVSKSSLDVLKSLFIHKEAWVQSSEAELSEMFLG